MAQPPQIPSSQHCIPITLPTLLLLGNSSGHAEHLKEGQQLGDTFTHQESRTRSLAYWSSSAAAAAEEEKCSFL